MSGINFPNRLNRKGVFLSSNMYNYINPTGFETCSHITNRVNFNNGLFLNKKLFNIRLTDIGLS